MMDVRFLILAGAVLILGIAAAITEYIEARKTDNDDEQPDDSFGGTGSTPPYHPV